MRGFIFVVLLTNIAFAQFPFRVPFFSSIEREADRLFFYETVNLVSEDSTKSRIDINFRIANDLLTFIKNPLDSPQYVADFTVSAEIFDKDGGSVGRKVFHGVRATDIYEETNSKIIFTQGNFRFDLAPGNYNLVLMLEDNQSKQVLKREKSLTLKPYREGGIEMSDLLLIQEREDVGDTIVLKPTNIGNRVNFGKGFIAYIQFTDRPVEAKYAVVFLGDFGKKKEVVKGVVESGEINNDRIFLFRQTPGDSIFTYLLIPSQPQRYFSLLIPIKGDSLDLGEYEFVLDVKFQRGDGTYTEKKFNRRFTVEWLDMPFSLQNIDYAIEILEYIASSDEMAKLRFGSPEARIAKFKEFWAKRDPTPGTIYNELMAEYYRRVDYAITNFSTLRDRDGARTDRGKVYIIYGQPTKIERRYVPGRPTEEIWYYELLKKKFVFVDEYGSFKLISVEKYET